METKNQYVIYPHPENEENQANLTPQDKLVYLAIRRYMNKDTMEAFPSYERLKADIKAVPRTIKKCVDNLVREGYLETEKRGRSIVYKFNNQKKFEVFSYDFLDKEDLTFTEKAYIIASQQYMFKDEPGIGKITLSSQDLAKRINMPESTISKCNKSLTAKDYLSIIRCNKRDEETGVVIQEKIFHLDELGQAVIWALHNHEERITNNEKTLNRALDEIAKLKAELQELRCEKIQTITL